MIQIYGSPRSSSGRCFWMLEEAGVTYQRQALNMQNKEHRTETYLKINPNGKVPCLVDDDFVIWESMAINHYVAEKYKPELLGVTVEEKALVQQWSYWSILELQKPLVDILIQEFFVPAEKKDHALVEKSKKALIPLMTILEKHLNNREFVVGSQFTLADINVGSVVNINEAVRNDVSSFLSISQWMKTLYARKAFQNVRAMDH